MSPGPGTSGTPLRPGGRVQSAVARESAKGRTLGLPRFRFLRVSGAKRFQAPPADEEVTVEFLLAEGFAQKTCETTNNYYSTDFRSFFANYMRQLEFYDFSLIDSLISFIWISVAVGCNTSQNFASTALRASINELLPFSICIGYVVMFVTCCFHLMVSAKSVKGNHVNTDALYVIPFTLASRPSASPASTVLSCAVTLFTAKAMSPCAREG